MSDRPTNLTEWREYIAGLAGEDLYSQTVAANSQRFASLLIEEGASMTDVEQVLLAFVRQCKSTGTRVPNGGPFSLVTMAAVDPEASKGATMSEQEADLLEQSRETGTDDFDSFLLEAEF